MKKIWFLSILAIIIISGALGVLPLPGSINFDMDSFQKNRQSWINTGIKDYSFNYFRSEFQSVDLDVSVINGAVEKVFTRPRQHEGPPMAAPLENGKTIDGLFEMILESYGSGKVWMANDWIYINSICVEYDPRYHFPVMVEIYKNSPPGATLYIVPRFGAKNFKPLHNK